MQHLTHRNPVWLLLVAMAAACGGSAFDGDTPTAGSGGGTSTGGNSSGGVTSTGGTTASGGASGGSGGVLPVRCALSKEVGDCDAAFPAFWHNPDTGVCEPFTYGGCGGNENRFETLADCQQACSSGWPNMDGCKDASQCVLSSTGCCGACEPVAARNYVALNRTQLDAYRNAKGCEGVACAPCPPPADELERRAQYFVATCVSGQCTVADIRNTKATECKSANDCWLREGARCCEGCDGAGYVAISSEERLRSLTCGDGLRTCPDCVSPQPDDLVAQCVDGRCQVLRP